MRRIAAATTIVLLAANAPASADMATDCTQMEDLTLTISACTQSIESGQWSGENLAWAFHNRAIAQRRSENSQKAVDDYSEAIRLKPDYASAFAGRGYAYYTLGDVEKALSDYDEALKLNPEYGLVYFNRAQLRCKNADAAGSITDRIQSIKRGHWKTADAQTWLAEHGFYKGEIDGVFGPLLEKAVSDWSNAACVKR